MEWHNKNITYKSKLTGKVYRANQFSVYADTSSDNINFVKSTYVKNTDLINGKVFDRIQRINPHNKHYAIS